MKRISKGKRLASLVQHCQTQYADYDNYPHKDELREALLKEQGYICCYCMQRIHIDKMRIEHWKPQSKYPDLQLEYSNLLGACQGNEGQRSELEHCDKRKGDTEITINPLKQNCETYIKYSTTGKIYSDDEAINTELNNVLNLNLDTLIKNRKAALDAVIVGFNKKYAQESWSEGIIKRELERYKNIDSQGKYKAYCQYIIYYLTKKRQKLSQS